jgi:hypothetical protein
LSSLSEMVNNNPAMTFSISKYGKTIGVYVMIGSAAAVTVPTFAPIALFVVFLTDVAYRQWKRLTQQVSISICACRAHLKGVCKYLFRPDKLRENELKILGWEPLKIIKNYVGNSPDNYVQSIFTKLWVLVKKTLP